MRNGRAIVFFHFSLLAAVLSCSDAASACCDIRDVGKAIEKGVHDAGKTIEKGTQDTGKAIEKGSQDTGKTIEKGAHDAGKTIEKAFQDIGNALTAHPNNDDPKYPPFHFPIKGVECPFEKKTSWRSYFATPTVIGVQFRWAKNLERPRALKSIDPAACYTVAYDAKKGFRSNRVFGYSRMYKPEYKDNHNMAGLPGDPRQFQINVDGVLLRYNEAGEIYDLRGRIAGTFVCYLSNECEQYKY